MRRRIPLYIATAAILLSISASSASAVSPAEIKAGMAAAPVATNAVDDVAALGLSATRVIYVPLGVGEVILSPLPGVSFVSGLTHIGKGILAPIRTAAGLATLPFALLRRAA